MTDVTPVYTATLADSSGTTTEVLASEDPTASETKRTRFKRRFHTRWRSARGDVRSLIQGGRHYKPTSTRSDPSAKIADFRQWLEATLDEDVIETVPQRGVRRGRHYTAPFVKDLYVHGLRQADRSLRQAGWEFDAPSPETSVRYPPHKDLLKQEHLAVYQDLEDAAHAAEKQATRAYRDSVREGRSATATIEAVNDCLDKVGRYRTDLVATSEAVIIINDAALARYEQIGAEEVGVMVEMVPDDGDDSLAHSHTHEHEHHTIEVLRTDRTQPAPGDDTTQTWSTSGDLRVCDECASMGGSTYAIDDIREGNAPMPVRDSHPNCRCYYTNPR